MASSTPARLSSPERALPSSAVLRLNARSARAFPRAEIDAFASTRAALAAVVRGDADAYLGFTPVVQYELANEEFHDLRVAFEEPRRTSDLRFGVPRGNTLLRDQLNQALASMSPADSAAIRVRWLSGNFDAEPQTGRPRLVLSPQEIAWLRSLPPLKVGFDNNGRRSAMSTTRAVPPALLPTIWRI